MFRCLICLGDLRVVSIYVSLVVYLCDGTLQSCDFYPLYFSKFFLFIQYVFPNSWFYGSVKSYHRNLRYKSYSSFKTLFSKS